METRKKTQKNSRNLRGSSRGSFWRQYDVGAWLSGMRRGREGLFALLQRVGCSESGCKRVKYEENCYCGVRKSPICVELCSLSCAYCRPDCKEAGFQFVAKATSYLGERCLGTQPKPTRSEFHANRDNMRNNISRFLVIPSSWNIYKPLINQEKLLALLKKISTDYLESQWAEGKGAAEVVKALQNSE